MSRTTVCLADLCDVVTDRVEPEEQPDAVYVGLKHLETGRFARKGEDKAAETKSSKSAFRAGDILYGKLRAYLDKAVLAEDEGICSTDILVVRSRQDVDPRFLLGVIHSPQFIEHAVAGTTGVSHPRTSWSHISEFQFPSYSPEEQKNIGDFLWLMHKALTASEAVVNAGQILKKVAMRKLFKFGLSKELQKETVIGPIPKRWKVSKFGDHYEIVQGMSIKGNLSSDESGVPFLRTSNIRWGKIDLSSVSKMNIDKPIVKNLLGGDLLICDLFEIGRAAIWSDEITNCTYQNHVHRLRPNDDSRVDSRFIMRWLEEGFCHRQVYEGVGNKTTIPNLSRSRLSEMSFPLPSREEQSKIADIIDLIDTKLEVHQRKLDILGQMTKIILHKIVTGKLESTVIIHCLDTMANKKG